ncbi:efflux RND transporter periplasmic adaptor subunit [Candidatus Uhrbacteria bacterium]|nr:efflux RND transporter periplasmic adaptor subunit [Candidatus Uhrbacteria bacterium]
MIKLSFFRMRNRQAENYVYIFMKRHYKAILIAALAISIAGVVFIVMNGEGKEPRKDVEPQVFAYPVKTETVGKGMEYAFTITGNVQVGQSATLPAESRASVTKVNVRPGDEVQKGEVLVQLQSDTLNTSYQNAAIMLANAQLSFATTQSVSGNSAEIERLRLETAEMNLQNTLAQNEILKSQSEQALESAKLNVDLSTDSAATALDSAKENLEKTKSLNEANLQTAETALANTIRSLKTDMFNGLNTANELLEVSPLFRGSAGLYRDAIGRRGEAEKRDAEAELEAAIDAYVAMEDTYESTHDTAKKVEDALDKTLMVLNLTDPSTALPQQVLSGYIQSISQSLAMVRGGISGMESANKTLETTIAGNAASLAGAKAQVASAEKALASTKQQQGDKSQTVINAEKQHEATLAQLKNAEDNARANVNTARLSYENAKKSSNLSVLSSKNALLTAQDAVDQIKLQIDKLTVRAPFAGRVASVPVNLGDEVNPGTALVVVENPETKKVEVQLTEDDVNRIKVGDKVSLNGKSGEIISIAPGADKQTKKFAVEVVAEELELQPGQFVEVEFTETDTAKDEKVFVPIASVHLNAEESFVWGIEDDATKKIVVELGELKGDEVEVAEGLAPGVEVIIEGGRIIEEEGVLVKGVEW